MAWANRGQLVNNLQGRQAGYWQGGRLVKGDSIRFKGDICFGHYHAVGQGAAFEGIQQAKHRVAHPKARHTGTHLTYDARKVDADALRKLRARQELHLAPVYLPVQGVDGRRFYLNQQLIFCDARGGLLSHLQHLFVAEPVIHYFTHGIVN